MIELERCKGINGTLLWHLVYSTLFITEMIEKTILKKKDKTSRKSKLGHFCCFFATVVST